MPSHPSINTNRVVIALLDGRRIKGFVYDFFPGGKTLNVFPGVSDAADKRPAMVVEFAACKAIFFVRTHEGNRELADQQHKAEPDPKRRVPRGKKVQVVFSDGESMICCTEVYNPKRFGFFVYPLDPRSNNLRIFIVNANVRQVLTAKTLNSTANARPEQERVARLSMSGKDEIAEDLKVEAALRVLNGEAPTDLEKDYGIPADEVTGWTRQFLESGRSAFADDAGAGTPGADILIRELKKRIRELEEEARREKPAPRLERVPG